jgi:ADP-heptose:LPS heptosyltransferase
LRLRAALSQLPLFWQLRRQRFDYAIVMGGDESHRGIRRAIASGASRVVAYARDPWRYGRSLTDPLPLPTEGHEVDRMLALLAPLGVGVAQASLDVPTFALPPDAQRFADDFLRARGLARRSFVVIGVGARRRKKQPTAEQVLRWSARLYERHGLHTVFMWTPGNADDPRYPGDDALARDVVDRGRAHVHPFRGPIREALGLIFAARTSIIPDSGLMHFAAASEGGVLGLFADPADSAPAARWAPLGPRARHLEALRCVAELDEEEIFAALAPLLTK